MMQCTCVFLNPSIPMIYPICLCSICLDLLLELRGFYIKLGQVGSTRNDFLPKAYLDRMTTLQDGKLVIGNLICTYGMNGFHVMLVSFIHIMYTYAVM